MNNLEKIKRQLAKPVEIVLKNSDGEEDTFLFKRLNIEQQAIMMELSKKFKSSATILVEGVEVPDIGKEDMKAMEDLIFSIVKNSMPEIEDEDILRQFTNDNFNQLFDKIEDLVPESPDSDKIKLIEQRRKATQDAKAEQDQQSPQ